MKLIPVAGYQPNRNWIRVGDTVKCRPLAGGRFEARVRSILADEEGVVREVEVYGGRGGRAAIRTFSPERITRMAQSRVEEKERG